MDTETYWLQYCVLLPEIFLELSHHHDQFIIKMFCHLKKSKLIVLKNMPTNIVHKSHILLRAFRVFTYRYKW